ncbi:5'-methylthioadenosine/S-adenosylhomocysteine nucleosidase [Niveispirillum lacus]|uniref:adenosylhomocysteine nucleosidase n=1 Tax=Niveispirillum lacus TaxID=1981099 RepID=A0A255YUA7_9PROT|nr:5'-methylthioadenosine/adenosylhomocysteine nucleosidase [Niveispirillum lacus]OYQ32769.1 5'-methylthioadenosine/S-adenosylhomocysteine nucleosidase [Niveispirillum lacus]
MNHSRKPLGLICAIPEETAALAGHFRRETQREIAGFVFTTGWLDGHPLVMVEAGIGKVNAALVGTLLLHAFEVRGLLFSGVAGGLDPALDVGDVVIADRLIQHDYGALSDGRLTPYQPGVPPLPGFDNGHGYGLADGMAPRIAAALEGVTLAGMPGGTRVPVWRFGTVLTGDHFLNCAETRHALHVRFNAQAVEMEGAALAQVAATFGVPLVVVRALSDLAGSDSHLDFPSFARIAAANAAAIVPRIVPLF